MLIGDLEKKACSILLKQDIVSISNCMHVFVYVYVRARVLVCVRMCVCMCLCVCGCMLVYVLVSRIVHACAWLEYLQMYLHLVKVCCKLYVEKTCTGEIFGLPAAGNVQNKENFSLIVVRQQWM